MSCTVGSLAASSDSWENTWLVTKRLKKSAESKSFFICINDQPELDFGGKRNPDGMGFAAFGKVTKGMDVVRAIQMQKDKDQFLISPVMINHIVNLQPWSLQAGKKKSNPQNHLPEL